jgi:hypothetical protein
MNSGQFCSMYESHCLLHSASGRTTLQRLANIGGEMAVLRECVAASMSNCMSCLLRQRSWQGKAQRTPHEDFQVLQLALPRTVVHSLALSRDRQYQGGRKSFQPEGVNRHCVIATGIIVSSCCPVLTACPSIDSAYICLSGCTIHPA